MKLVIERKWKKKEYTIGVLWIDGVKICNTLEPVDRGLTNEAMPGKIITDEWKTAETKAKMMKAAHPKGTTAIPAGRYRVVSAISSKFHARRLYLRDVPGFDGIMIHEGNTRKDTAGCILVGENTVKGSVLNSKYWLEVVNKKVFEAVKRNDVVILSVNSSFSRLTPL